MSGENYFNHRIIVNSEGASNIADVISVEQFDSMYNNGKPLIIDQFDIITRDSVTSFRSLRLVSLYAEEIDKKYFIAELPFVNGLIAIRRDDTGVSIAVEGLS